MGRQEALDLPLDQKILWITLGLSLICFAITFTYRSKLFKSEGFRHRFLLGIVTATIIFVVCEAMPISYLRGKIPSTDLTFGIPLDAHINLDGGYSLQSEILTQVGLIIILFFIIRTLFGYFAAKKIILLPERLPHNIAQETRYQLKKYGKIKLLIWSFFFIGLPLEAILLFLFGSFYINFLSLFIISLLVDIAAMLFIVLIVGKRLTVTM